MLGKLGALAMHLKLNFAGVGFSALVVLTMLSASKYAGAATLIGMPSSVEGISHLIIDGTPYDVSFKYDTYANIFGSATPTFNGNLTGANDAINAIVKFFNAEGVTGIAGISETFEINVPHGVQNGGLFPAVQGFLYPTNLAWTNGGTFDLLDDTFWGHNVTAVFAPAATPIPATFPLFGSCFGGLVLLGWWSRLRQRLA
jgi:hypothetical protein